MIITKKEFAELNNGIDEKISSITEAVRSSEDKIATALVLLTDISNNNSKQIMKLNNKIEHIEKMLLEISSTVSKHGEISARIHDNMQSLNNVITETKNTIQTDIKSLSGTNSQLSEALNMLMIQHLLDKAEKVTSDSDNSSILQLSPESASKKQDSPHIRVRCLRCGSKLDGYRYCKLCGFDNVEEDTKDEPEVETFDFSNPECL